MALTDGGQRRFTVIIITSVIAFVAVLLRFWCKFQLRNGFHADDWWILLCLLTWYGAMASLLWGIFSGTGGKDVHEVAIELQQSPSPARLLALENFLESLYISVTIYFFTLYSAKVALCLLYRRIFSVGHFRLIASILMGISTAWIIATEVANLVHCIPIDIFWHRSKGVKCLNFNLIFLIVGTFEIILDIGILALPIWAISTIQMRLKTKVLAGGIFLLGGFSIVTNILRVYYTYQPGAEFVAVTDSEFWTEIHVAVTILCACLPVYKPLRLYGNSLFSKVHSTFSSLQRLAWSYTAKPNFLGQSREQINSEIDMNDLKHSQDKNVHSHPTYHREESDSELMIRPTDGVNVVTIRHNEASEDGRPPPVDGIRYVKQVEVV